MGLTCSLLGHRFGDPVVEQDREDRGQEAVTVTREVVVCERCGERRIRSESTEVAAVTDHPDADAGTDADTDAGTAPAGEPATRADGDAATAEGTGSTAEPEAEAEPEPEADPDLAAPEGEPEDEGAEILTDDSDADAGERGFGEWPEAPESTPDPTEPEPASPSGSEGPAGDGADGDTGGAPGEDAAETDADAEAFEEAAGADDGPTRLVCPDCGFSVGATGSPLRAGDACPDCSSAYLAERNE
jgi:hypothetical protein